MPNTDVERLLTKIIKTSDPNSCWLWTGCISPQGYGQFSLNKHRWQAHIAAWHLLKGPVPDGICVLHKCNTRSCVNPDHLYLGTQADNARDLINTGYKPPGRQKNYCKHGHEFSGDNVYLDPQGHRRCRTCMHNTSASRWARIGKIEKQQCVYKEVNT